MIISRRTFIQLLGFTSLLGIYPFAQAILSPLSHIFFSPFPVILYDHIRPFFYPEKKAELIGYLLFLIISSIYGLTIFLASSAFSKDELTSKWHLPTIGASLLINLSLWTQGPDIVALAWMVIAVFPFLLQPKVRIWVLASPGSPKWLGAMSAIAMTVMFLPILLAKPHIESEYYNIPTTTLIGSKKEKIDTIAFLNSHPFLGLNHNDPTRENLQFQSFPWVKIGMTDDLNILLSKLQEVTPPQASASIRQQPLDASGRNSLMPEDLVSMNIIPLVYDDGRLVAIQDISKNLQTSLEDSVAPEEKIKIHILAEESHAFSKNQQKHYYTNEEREFISVNNHEITADVLARRIFHHQNFMLGAIQELELGRSIKDINLQYGFLPIYLFQKILHNFGGVTFQSYFHLLSAFYVIYIVSSSLLIWLIFKNFGYGILYLGFSTAIVAGVGYDVLVTAPGMNPIRHLLDIGTITLCCLYLRSNRTLLLLPIYSTCLLSIYCNSQSGLSLTLAVTAGLSCLSIFDNTGWRRLPIISSFIALIGVLLAFKYQPGRDELSYYYFEGLCGFPIHTNVVIAIVIVFGLGYLLLFRTWKMISKEEKATLIILIFYSQLMFLYYIWGGSKYHLLNYASIYFLTLLYVVHIALREEDLLIKYSSSFYKITQLAIIALLGISTVHFLYQEFQYREIFSHHVSYEWDSPKASLSTTMPEKPFESAAAAINKFEHNSGIYIISEFDNFLPFYSNKYSAMPYPDLQWFINSDIEKNEVIACINENKPKILFTDANIERQLGYEVADPHVPLFGVLQAESILRIQRIRVLQEIFNSIKDDYLLKDRAGLIETWERKSISPAASTSIVQ